MVWGKTLPSGRERAIETLIDMEPQGSFYRATRVLEESVPQSLSHRPNLVTKATLVEQAYGLAKNEIDQTAKYDQVFGSIEAPPIVKPTSKEKRQRIVRHHEKILAVKKGLYKPNITPSPQLVAALRHVYGEGESSTTLRTLLQSLMDHPAFAKVNDNASDEPAHHGSYQLESLIAGICESKDDSSPLHRSLISVLSVLTSFESDEADKESDPSYFPTLQVGGLLSVINPKGSDANSWAIDDEVLSFFGNAASAYEERIEIQKSRMMARLDGERNAETPDARPQQQTPGSTNPAVTPSAGTPQPTSTPDAVAIPEDAEDLDAAAAALSAAIFEQIASAAAGEDTSSNEDDGDSFVSDSDGESEFEREGEARQAMNTRSSSSSSSSSAGEPGDNDSDDEDMILRQALTMSLAEQAQSEEDGTSISENATDTPSWPITPTNNTFTPAKAFEPDKSDSPLPPLPTAPMDYPYSDLLQPLGDVGTSKSPYFDPTALNHFGTLPLPHILIHLLRCTLESIQEQKFQAMEDTSDSKTPRATVTGSIGSHLFPASNAVLKPHKSWNENPGSIATSLQLLVALFLLVSERRNDAIENLKKAIKKESTFTQENDIGESDLQDDDAHGASPEGDDPAVAMALHYVDEDETKDSLESKGMPRKAAAAAHDNATLLKSLRRRTNGWKLKAKLFSQCTLLSMKCIRLFLQSVVRRWLNERQGMSALDCFHLLPTGVLKKLSMGLQSLASIVQYKAICALLKDKMKEVEEALMPLSLYRDSTLTWGECVPILCPTVSSQVDVLKALLSGCARKAESAQACCFDEISSFPSSDYELQFHKLHVFCRRLRVADILDHFVSLPACYIPAPNDEAVVDVDMNSAKEPNRACALIELIFSSSKSLGGISGELQFFFLALCHRYHTRVLLWDGLFTSTEPESDDISPSSTPANGDIMRVAATPSDSLQFDATKCSDSMALINPEASGSASGASVHQRASKVWGTVLSSTSYSPKTGVYRWAVKLDKCERGHVFVGVATSQASMGTYVGGDKYGWGMIGTQALWHDRRKIRGDYGATFRTGSTIIVTLDTDAGTLGFSSWKDTNLSNSFSLDPLVQNLASPRRQGQLGGAIEEWGIAFEGLPLDSRLYPAVGLYQRDDRVTILTVESGGRSGKKDNGTDLLGGMCYYPPADFAKSSPELSAKAEQVRNFNEKLSWDGVLYAKHSLQHILEGIKESNDEFLWESLMPSLASALCLMPPSIPLLSERSALALMPELTKCVLELEHRGGNNSVIRCLFDCGLRCGKWVIRATGTTGNSSDSEEYVVDISSSTGENGSVLGFEGHGVGTTGKSKNGLVSIFGTIEGSSIHFVEEWTDASDESFSKAPSDDSSTSCVVAARLSLDGSRFEGSYRNVQFGTAGKIAGFLSAPGQLVDQILPKHSSQVLNKDERIECASASGEALLCLAHGHLSNLVSDDTAGDQSLQDDRETELSSDTILRHQSLRACLSLPLLSKMGIGEGKSALQVHVNDLQELYAPSTLNAQVVSAISIHENLIVDLPEGDRFRYQGFSDEISKVVDQLDNEACAASGGRGSLSALCPSEYSSARRRLICAFVHHSGLKKELKHGSSSDGLPQELITVWRFALQMMEDGLRQALALKSSSSSRETAAKTCSLYESISSFFIKYEVPLHQPVDTSTAARDLAHMFQVIVGTSDLSFLAAELSRSSKRVLLRLASLKELQNLLSSANGVQSPTSIEALAVTLPKILGRRTSPGISGKKSQNPFSNENELGVHYMDGLAGVPGLLRYTLQENVHGLMKSLCSSMKRVVALRTKTSNPESLVCIDSMILVVLSCFTSAMKHQDLELILTDSGLVSLLPQILDQHHGSMLGPTFGIKSEGKNTSLVQRLESICHREISRSILRAVVALVHVIVYQATASSDSVDGWEGIVSRCSNTVLGEVSILLPRIRSAYSAMIAEHCSHVESSQWEEWSDVVTSKKSKKEARRKKRTIQQVGGSGLRFLDMHGPYQSIVPQSSSQRSSRSRGGQSTTSSPVQDSVLKFQSNFCHQFLSQWLHIVVCLAKSEKSRTSILKDFRWMALLLEAIGLIAKHDQNGNISAINVVESSNLLPGRYRSRVLRLMFPLLVKSEPSTALICGLFSIAGCSSALVSKSIDEDEKGVACEVISLLRHLHATNQMDWRSNVNTSIAGILQSREAADTMERLGVFCFFNGGFDAISRGSYVLLKPAPATPLSAHHQGTSNSKGHSNSSSALAGLSSTPHHIVGNGTEGIVAGLCREEASGGIVSSIDMKNGICEVVLLNRKLESNADADVEEPSLRRTPAVSASVRSNGSRHSLTVRALRSPLRDVVQALEVPLFLDDSIPTEKLLNDHLPAAIQTLEIQASRDCNSYEEKEDTEPSDASPDAVVSAFDDMNSEVIRFTEAVMTIRAAATLLCDENMVLPFLEHPAAKIILSKMLKLACTGQSVPNSGDHRYLSSLPSHETRFVHLISLHRSLDFRAKATLEISKEEWKSRRQELEIKKQAIASDLDKVASESDTKDENTAQADSSGEVVSSTSGQSGSSERTTSQDADSASNGALSQTNAGSDNSEGEDESEAAATAAAHLREAAIAQMAELGLPRSWSELALRRTGGTNIEAAVHFCLERGGGMERLLAEERERLQRQSSGSMGRHRSSQAEQSTQLLQQLLEMGFPSRWCAEGLAATGNNVDEALTWILSNGERLSAEDEGMEDGDEDDDIDDDDEDDQSQDDDESAIAHGATNSEASDNNVNSEGTATAAEINTLAISGLPTGGFSSVGTKGVMLTSGKWYYEAILETAGCLQIGWADGSFSGHCHAERGDGCGDGPSSWAYDGWRRYRWHATATEWGCRWKEGDIIGCLVDMDDHVISFTLNGRAEEIGMGVAFSGEGFRPCGGVYACVSFNRREKLRLILGGRGSEPFKHNPPPGYRGIGDAVLDAVTEREALVAKEAILDLDLSMPKSEDEEEASQPEGSKRFLCDFSDGEHGHELMAWAHRYYGSDASVHLGSSRIKSSGARKHTSSSHASEGPSVCLDRRLAKLWKEYSAPQFTENVDSSLFGGIAKSHLAVGKRLHQQLSQEFISLSSLLSRKLLLHIVVAMGEKFDPNSHLEMDGGGAETSLRLWMLLEESASLRSAGWVGEAGAMAIAAEALGLGISSNDASQSRHSGIGKPGLTSLADLNDDAVLPSTGATQLLSTLLEWKQETDAYSPGGTLVASAESVLCSDGGSGILAFLQKGLIGAVCKSPDLRRVIIASIRRSVRRLAVVEYDGDDASDENSDEDEEAEKDTSSDKQPETADSNVDPQPDARLVCFMTGLLLTPQVKNGVDDFDEIMAELFEAWSVGMLSASLPWRMICAFTAAGILNGNPSALRRVVESVPTLCRYYGRLESTVSRRVWAERASTPVCSRYVQAMMELLCSVKRAVGLSEMPADFARHWNTHSVDAATPLPLRPSDVQAGDSSWESRDHWISSDDGWEVLSGSVKMLAVDWKVPTRSAVRTLMDGGDGPPMLREGCTVMRGLDWEDRSDCGNEDGKDKYEEEKSKREETKQRSEESVVKEDTASDLDSKDDTPVDSKADSDDNGEVDPAGAVHTPSESPDKIEKDSPTKKKKKIPIPKLPLGTVLSIEGWDGLPGMARRVRWHLTGEEGVYRYGGDGGRYDISHVEVNEKSTRVRKRHPLPESAEQCAARHGFGVEKSYSVLLRLRNTGQEARVDDEIKVCRTGVLEWPDFGAGILVDCTFHTDGAVTICEKKLLFGSKDSGWEARFGQASFKSGTTVVLTPTGSSSPEHQTDLDSNSPDASLFEELLGTSSLVVETLRNRDDGNKLRLTSEMRILRGQQFKQQERAKLTGSQAPMPAPIRFDTENHASSLALSKDGRTVSCVSSEGRGIAFSSTGFTKGVHYWEVKLEQADIGSVYIGVAEKPNGSGSGSSYGYDNTTHLNRWHGWGFVNFRATYTAGAERIYGAHCHAGDTVGVLLDCDAGRLSFFFDGLKYGEHILNDLGCAFENISPFGFNVDGCGSGGAAQGAPSGSEGGRSGRYPAQGAVRPRALWPVIGLRNHGDRVTLSPKWMSSYGIDGLSTVRNAVAVDEIFHWYSAGAPGVEDVPEWFLEEAFAEYHRWASKKWYHAVSRGSGPYRSSNIGLELDLDCSPLACACASALLGLKLPLLSGDKVKLKRSAGRILELAEEAIVLGAFQGRLYYRIVSQKSEGGSLTEGGGRAWCWDESEVVDGLITIDTPKCLGVELPLMNRFKCTSPGGLKIVYEGGAVVRSDLEIFDGSMNLGSIPFDEIIPQVDVLERRVNSCGVVRYRVRFQSLEGWISSKIRGGKEEAIVAAVESTENSDEEIPSFFTAQECAEKWHELFAERVKNEKNGVSSMPDVQLDFASFKSLASSGIIEGLSSVESDSFLSRVLSAICDFSESGNVLYAPIDHVASAISFALASSTGKTISTSMLAKHANQAAATLFASLNQPLPSFDSIMARVAMLRALNRRARVALPWLSVRPCQESSAMLGGIRGHGTSIDRAGCHYRTSTDETWSQVESFASKLRAHRGLLFSSVKRDLLQSITEVTTTPTPLSHDEYELPREIRTVRLNRLKARRVIASTDLSAKRKHSVFSQLQNETKSWGGAALRRGFVAKGHGGQKRAFKVKLIGEGVNDYSGPYREAFTDAFSEILSLDDQGSGALGVLDATPNNISQIGENRGIFMFSSNGVDVSLSGDEKNVTSAEEEHILNSFSSLVFTRDERSREVEEALVFLGRLTGTAFRHGIPLDLPLPLESTWRAIVEEYTSESKRMNELDELAAKQQQCTSGRSALLKWQQRMLNSFVEGLSNVIPVEILTILTGEELRDIICGNPDIDVDLLKRVVEYEGFEATDSVVEYFWETLREFTNDERKKFLQFVWARNRLPMKESDFEAPFKIQRDSSEQKKDKALPSASTCFFSLSLPQYSNKKTLKEKLLFAINNVATMETDFQTNAAEISEGYRAF
ncbi:MAG: hypothetical protein SGBAC_001899 [Bacillariaceae sp.]